MVDVENDDAVAGLVNAIADPVFAPARPPEPLEGRPQRGADQAWPGGEGPLNELPSSEGGSGGQSVGKGSARARGENDGVRGTVRLFSGHDARAVAARP